MCMNTDKPNPSEAPKRAPVPLRGVVNAPATAPLPGWLNVQ